MASSQYPNISENHLAGLLQVATAAASAQERNASAALGKRKRDDEAYIDHQLRTPAAAVSSQEDAQQIPTLQSSAAVLFREPSEKSKKYSRPPLGKVYTDLELPPELFLQLQSAAKAFMLDPNHPERKSVVGQKKQNGNNDVAKLKLWNCVEQFLLTPHEKSGELNCEYYFGHHAGAGVPNPTVRTFFWPEDRDQVIKMCMPLFRKMVTNERQRLYASETRKQDPGRQDKTRNLETSEQLSQNELDQANVDVEGPTDHEGSNIGATQHNQTNMFLAQTTTSPAQSQVMLHVNIVTSGVDSVNRRVTPRITIPSEAAPTREALIAEVQKSYDIGQHRSPENPNSVIPSIQVWLENGLVPIRDEASWMDALLSSNNTEWMDGELRILLEV